MSARWPAAVGAVLVPAIVAAAILWPAPLPTAAMDFSFEDGLEGWSAGAAGAYAGNCTAGAQGNCTMAWSVERTAERAREGAFSVRLYLDNLQDQGRIWMVRAFDATPSRLYRLQLAFAFASSDGVTVKPWGILAGALSTQPTTSQDMAPTYRGGTGSGSPNPGEYVWLEKAYDSTVRASSDGHLWVVMGLWGTCEGPRTYYVDTVRVTLQAA
jgi:hypothetical protein